MPTDAHAAPPDNAPEALYDESIATPTHAERARTMAAQLGTGTLCTLSQSPSGYPYGSFVTVAFDQGHPVFLISELAEHTKNLRENTKASLLLAEGGEGDPLAHGRITLVGDCSPVAEDPSARDAFLARHGNASYYVDFKDFHFWRLEVASVRYIGGYGRMSWVTLEQWLGAEPDPIGPIAAGIIEHMNTDHADAMPLYCRALSRGTQVAEATMTGIDRYGFEMSAVTPTGPRPIRVAFPEPIEDATSARKSLVALLHEARRKLGLTS